MYDLVMEFVEWINDRKRDWEKEYHNGRKMPNRPYADFLGIEEGTVNHWLGDRRLPNEENAKILADKYGNEIYDILDIPRPDPIYKEWLQIGYKLDKEEVKRLIHIIPEMIKAGHVPSNVFDSHNVTAEENVQHSLTNSLDLD